MSPTLGGKYGMAHHSILSVLLDTRHMPKALSRDNSSGGVALRLTPCGARENFFASSTLAAHNLIYPSWLRKIETAIPNRAIQLCFRIPHKQTILLCFYQGPNMALLRQETPMF